jgi:hypothetical protein
MRKIGLKAAMAGTGGLCLLAAGAASATTTYPVAVGGSTVAGGHRFTGTGSLAIGPASCTSATIAGTVNSGPGVTDVLDIDTLTTSGCTGPGGNMAVTQLSTWYLVADSGYTSGTSDVVQGHLTNIDAHVATTPLSSVCSFDVIGTASASLNEGSQTLTIDETGGYTGNLTLANVSGCGGQLHDGDPADASGTFALTIPDGPINVG